MDEQKKKDYLAQIESGIEKSKEDRIKEVESNLLLHMKAKENAVIEQKLKDELLEIIVKNPKPLTLEHEYQQKPRFWEINEELSRMKHVRDREGHNSLISGLDRTVEIKQEELARLKGE